MALSPTSSRGSSSSGGSTQYDYVERTTNQTVSTETNYIVGNAVTYDGSTRVRIEVFATTNALATSSGVILVLYEDATALGRICDSRQGTGGGADSTGLYGVRFRTPSAGSHTYKVTSILAGAGTVILNAGAGGDSSTYLPAFLRVASG